MKENRTASLHCQLQDHELNKWLSSEFTKLWVVLLQAKVNLQKTQPTLFKVDLMGSPFTSFLLFFNPKEQISQSPSFICSRNALLGTWNQARSGITPRPDSGREVSPTLPREGVNGQRETHSRQSQMSSGARCQLCLMPEDNEQASLGGCLSGGHSAGAGPGTFTGALILILVACGERKRGKSVKKELRRGERENET